jgi:hypothetical protein
VILRGLHFCLTSEHMFCIINLTTHSPFKVSEKMDVCGGVHPAHIHFSEGRRCRCSPCKSVLSARSLSSPAVSRRCRAFFSARRWQVFFLPRRSRAAGPGVRRKSDAKHKRSESCGREAVSLPVSPPVVTNQCHDGVL